MGPRPGRPQEGDREQPAHACFLVRRHSAAGYIALVDGRKIDAGSIDLLARIFSMGVLHHAMTGTGAVAIAAAAAIPGTVVSRIAPVGADGRVKFGHPSGVLNVGAEACTLKRSGHGGRQGDDEPLGAPPDGRLGAGAGLRGARLAGGGTSHCCSSSIPVRSRL